MAKKYYASSARKKGRTSRLRKRNPYRGKAGMPEAGGLSRFYPAMPRLLKVAVPWHFDTRHEIPVNTLTYADGAAVTVSAYWYYDTLDMAQMVGPASTTSNPTSSISQYPYSAAHYAMMNMYSEMRYKTTVYDLEFSADWSRTFSNSAHAGNFVQDEPNISVCVGVMPGQYFKATSTTFHNSSGAGRINPNTTYPEVFDYYTALSQQPGTKQLFLPTNGNQEKRQTARMIVDAYAHDGTTQVATGTYTWAQDTARPSTTMAWPNPNQRQWVVVAVRARFINYGVTIAKPQLFVRTSGKITQHVTYGDPFPSTPYGPVNTFT